MRRRDFIKVVAGLAITRPLAVRAQQPEQFRRIAVLSNKSSGDVQGREEAAAFAEALKTRGWTSGGNVQIDYRWGAGDEERYRTYAAELVAQAPDALLAVGGTVTGALQRLTRDIPIVFVATSDPIVESLGGKWVEVLNSLMRRLGRVRDLQKWPVNGTGSPTQRVTFPYRQKTNRVRT
jgi:putative ABC transport system substrate-binding protein